MVRWIFFLILFWLEVIEYNFGVSGCKVFIKFCFDIFLGCFCIILIIWCCVIYVCNCVLFFINVVNDVDFVVVWYVFIKVG